MFLITGSGRSGTSAVARLLHEAGLSTGRQLVAADDFNAEGYFEEYPVIELNQHILQDAGLGGLSSEASRGALIDAAQPYVEQMMALAAEATPAWKDPRFCWTLEPWLAVLEGRPRLIVCLRNPEEVAASTLRYYGQVSEQASEHVRRLWRNQYQRLLMVTGAYRLDATCVEYGALHTDPETAAGRLSAFVGRTLDPLLVRVDLRHHETAVPPGVLDLFQQVLHVGT